MESGSPKPARQAARAGGSILSAAWFRFILFFLVGVLAGFLIPRVLPGNKEASLPVSVAPKESATVSKPADTLGAPGVMRYDNPLVRAACKVRYSSKIVEISVDLSSLYPVKSVLDFDVNNFTILEVRHVSVNDQSTSMTASGSVQFNSVGDNHYMVLLVNMNNLPHKIDFILSQNDVTLYQKAAGINDN